MPRVTQPLADASSGSTVSKAAGKTDSYLAKQVMHGDNESWEHIVRRHIAAVAGYLGTRIANYEVVQDITIQTFHEAWEKRSSLPAAGEKLGTLVRRFAASLARKWQHEHGSASFEGRFPVSCCEDSPTMYRRLDHLHQAMMELPEQARKVLEYTYRSKLTGDDLADALRCDRSEIEACTPARCQLCNINLSSKALWLPWDWLLCAWQWCAWLFCNSYRNSAAPP